MEHVLQLVMIFAIHIVQPEEKLKSITYILQFRIAFIHSTYSDRRMNPDSFQSIYIESNPFDEVELSHYSELMEDFSATKFIDIFPRDIQYDRSCKFNDLKYQARSRTPTTPPSPPITRRTV